MIYYTSDLHIGHANALRFDNRPFADLDEEERAIIANWNSRVRDGDDVYILGDVFFKYKNDMTKFLSQLHGRLHLVVGNHDQKLLADETAMARFVSVEKLEAVNDNGRLVVLCHFPIAEWYKKPHGAYHVYGHIHRKVDETTRFMLSCERAFNAGCMINGYYPCTLEELEENKKAFIREIDAGEE